MRQSAIAAGLFLAAIASAAASGDLLPNLPMRFESAPVGNYRYIARGAGYAVAFGDRNTLFAAGDRSVSLTFEGSNPQAAFQPLELAPAATNYFHADQRRSVPAFGRLRRRAVYPGIDVVYYGSAQNLEYDFELAPGSDPSRIALRFDGADRVGLNDQGDVVLDLGGHQMVQKLPAVYQRTQDHEISGIPSSYRLDDQGVIRLNLGEYDRTKPLVIDPAILLTGYLPGTGAEGVAGIARDAKGFVYIAGFTFSTDFALVGDVYSAFLRNNLREGYVTKIDPTRGGNDLIVYSSFIGSSAEDNIMAVTVDRTGVVYLAGTTNATDYPTTPSGYVTTFAGGTNRLTISALDTTQGANGLLYSTYFGGTKTDVPTGIAVSGGLIYVTGYTTSDDFPMANAMTSARVGSYDAYISVFDPSKSGKDSLPYSTYFGGGGQDLARSIAVGADGTVYIAGNTHSVDLPTSAGAYRTSYSGAGDAFLTRIDINTNQVVYSTYFGGSDYDDARKIVLEPSGRVGITGYTFSDNFPITQTAFQPVYSGNSDIFFSIFDPSAQGAGALVYSTYFGGSDGEVAYDLKRDASGKYYLCGYTLSKDFPMVNALYPVSANGGVDAFVAILNPAAPPNAALTYSSYITSPGTQVAYGLELDSNGGVMVTGVTTGVLFPEGQAQPSLPSNTNVFLLLFQP